MKNGLLLLTEGRKDEEKEDKLYTTGFAVTAILILVVIIGVVGSVFFRSPNIRPRVASSVPTRSQRTEVQDASQSAIIELSPVISVPLSPTATPTPIPTPTYVPTATPTPQPTAIPTPTHSPIPTPTITSTLTSTPTPIPSPTITP